MTSSHQDTMDKLFTAAVEKYIKQQKAFRDWAFHKIIHECMLPSEVFAGVAVYGPSMVMRLRSLNYALIAEHVDPFLVLGTTRREAMGDDVKPDHIVEARE